MKYVDFVKKVKEINREAFVLMSCDNIIIYYHGFNIKIARTKTNCLTDNFSLNTTNQVAVDLLACAVEFTQTPIAEREYPLFYYVKISHNLFLTRKNDNDYVKYMLSTKTDKLNLNDSDVQAKYLFDDELLKFSQKQLKRCSIDWEKAVTEINLNDYQSLEDLPFCNKFDGRYNEISLDYSKI